MVPFGYSIGCERSYTPHYLRVDGVKGTASTVGKRNARWAAIDGSDDKRQVSIASDKGALAPALARKAGDFRDTKQRIVTQWAALNKFRGLFMGL